MRAFYFWLKHSLYDFPLMTMLYFSGFKQRKDESNDFNCNNLQTLNVLRNASGITKLVNDSHPLWKRIHRNPKHLSALCCGYFNYNYNGFKNTNYMQFVQLYCNVFSAKPQKMHISEMCHICLSGDKYRLSACGVWFHSIKFT